MQKVDTRESNPQALYHWATQLVVLCELLQIMWLWFILVISYAQWHDWSYSFEVLNR
jgi:hypothetical protein